MRILVFLALVATAYGSGLYLSPRTKPNSPTPCEHSACFPQTGNLLIGKATNLTASSTCGTHGSERYCIIQHVEDKKRCFRCDSTDAYVSNPGLSHRIDNVIERFAPSSQSRSWWQSEPGVEDVTIQLDLDAVYHMTHVIMFFKTFRPAAMYIERSADWGQTWSVSRYFAYDCAHSFPGVPTVQKSVTDVICESRYSQLDPSTDGETLFRVINGRYSDIDPNSQEIKDLLRVTNLRIRFTKLHTIGNDRIGQSADVNEKYYYAIYEMVIRGSCACNGHASRCVSTGAVVDSPANMVHGQCECVHHTKGDHCEQCEDGFKPREGKRWVGDWDVCERDNENIETANNPEFMKQLRDHIVSWTQRIWNFMA